MKQLFTPGSLARQLILPMTLAAVGLMTLALFGIHHVSQRKILGDLQQSAEMIVTAIVSAAENVSAREDLRRFVSTMAAEPQVNVLLLVAGRDRVVVASSRYDWLGLNVDELPDDAMRATLRSSLAGREDDNVFLPGGGTYQRTRRILLVLPGDQNLVPAEAAALVQLDVAAVRATRQRDLFWFAFGAVLGLVLLLTLLGRLLYSRILTPLGGLRRQLEADATGQNLLQLPARRTHEIDLLVNSINTARRTREEHLATSLQAAAALTQSEARLRAVFEGAPVGITAAAADEGRLILANPAMARMFGTDLTSLLHRPVSALHPAWAQEQVEAGFARIAAGNFAPQIQPCRRDDGGIFYCAITPWPIQIDGRDCLLAFFSDVTAEHEAREALAASQADLLSAQRLARLGSWRFSPATGRFTFSEQLPVILGIDPANLTPANLRQFLHPAELPLLEKAWLDTLQGKVVEMEHRLVIGDQERWMFSHAETVRDGAGRHPVIQGVSLDITGRKHTELALQRTQRLESIGTLAGGVAHDLNNLLSPILLAAELAKQQAPAAVRSCEMIATSARRASGIVRQLLTFARGLGGERGPVQIRHEIREMEAFIRSSFDRSITIEVNCPRDLPLLMADPNQLHQVLLNLAINARDAMPAGGRLHLGVTLQPAAQVPAGGGFGAAVQPRDYVCITVTDTGCGIPADKIDRIFDPFYTTKGPDKGTGLGLSTVLGIVKSHEGFIRVACRADEGCVFEVWLPCIAVKAISAHPFDLKTPRGNHDVVLVVDDEAAVREMLTLLLESWGFVVTNAADGAEALHALNTNAAIRLVITDINMPNLDGLALIEALRRHPRTLPVLVITGLLDEVRVEALRALDAKTVLSKPFTVGDLARTLANWPDLPAAAPGT
jgi:PAS domain S-box-containing protein